MADIDDTDNLYLHCAGGYRSVIAASLMKRQGIHNLRNITGGWDSIKEETRIPTERVWKCLIEVQHFMFPAFALLATSLRRTLVLLPFTEKFIAE